MDGASRFTQRDAVASLLITGINIMAGFLIGVLQHGMELRHALETYTVLTIGDGLVTVIPALMISISGGLIITRTSSDVTHRRRFSQTALRQPAAAVPGQRAIVCAWRVSRVCPQFPSFCSVAVWARSPGACARSRLQRSRRSLRPPNPRERKSGSPVARRAPGHRSWAGAGKMVEGAQNSPLLRRISGSADNSSPSSVTFCRRCGLPIIFRCARANMWSR